MTSTNGVNWSTVSGPSGQWNGIAFGGGLFVAVGSVGQIITSSDGVNWTQTFLRPRDHFTSVAYGNGRFEAVDTVHGDTAVAIDGTHWAFYLTPQAGLQFGAVAYGDGNFAALDSSGFAATTVSGYVWTVHSYAPAQLMDSITYGCNSFVAVGQDSGSTNNFLTSTTGASWGPSPVPTDTTANWTAVAYGSHRYVAVDDAGNIATATTSANCAQTTPMAPRDISGFPHNGSVLTFLHPPLLAGGAPVDGYRITISDGMTTKTCHAPVYYEPSCNITGLINRRVYEVTTQSHNRYGYSVPSDPEMAIPVSSWKFNVQPTTQVVLASAGVVLQETGVTYNSEGIYPHSLITVHFGTRIVTCRPNPFGECLLPVSNPATGPVSIYATYTGYGVSYVSPTFHLYVATINTSSTDVVTGHTITVTVNGAVPGSTLKATLAGQAFQVHLDSSGSGQVDVTAPNSTGEYVMSVSDASVGLDNVNVSVHS
jgi:hypothetical protein